MKEEFSTEAINLNSTDFGENDKIVRVYSKTDGLLSCVVRGCRKSKSRNAGAVQPFISNYLFLSRRKNLNVLYKADSLNPFFKIRTDCDKMFYSMYCAEVVETFGNENDDESEKIYEVLYKFLNAVSEAANKTQIMLSTIKFQLKAAKAFGYAPELNKCTICGEKIKGEYCGFSAGLGGIVCLSHNRTVKKLHPKILDFLREMSDADFTFETYYDRKANEQVCKACFGMISDYLQYVAARKFKTFEILQTV